MNVTVHDRLRRSDWVVRDVEIAVARRIVESCHYARAASNTATYLHGLFHEGDIFQEQCEGVAWWIPPTRSAAEATYPENWKGVLSLSRLAILPGVPLNACTFLLSRSRKLIPPDVWPCLVTYADEWRGHTGGIYRADNWTYVGKTRPERTYVVDGRLVSRKAGPLNRTHAEMVAIGAEMVGSFSKHKFIMVRRHSLKRRPASLTEAQKAFYAGFTPLRVTPDFKIGSPVEITGDHPWTGERGVIVAFERSPADRFLGCKDPAILARVRLKRDDAMDGHECYAEQQNLRSRTCKYGDPLCPCQDGDMCHYEGPNPMRPPRSRRTR